MDAEIVRKHKDLIEMVALHNYLPDGSHQAVVELSGQYPHHVDMWCGNCLVTMFKWFYLNREQWL